MKKVLVWLSVMAMAAAMFAGCGQKEEEKNGSAVGTPVEDMTTLTVGFDASFPPYGYLENGEYVGFDLDLAAEVCKRNKWELVKQPIDWDARDMELSTGSIDCIWNGFTINGREDLYTWSEPYVDNSQVFAVATESGIKTKAELKGKVVAVQKESSALAALNDEKNKENIALRDSFKQLIEYADYNTAFMDLEQGAVDAVAIDIGVAQYQIASRKEGAFMMLPGEENKLATEQYGVGFLLGNEDLRDKIQETLNAMAEDGTFAKIAEKWGLTDSICIGK
ncbi:MAG: amino acid ABC transporter substrate-binding protein [Lachnospiraceae bacterium]|nr:amino acid ABC transporter substrate-binding protein [Lachnospiraceae bacterium]